MPTYDYRCRKCGHRFELFHSIRDQSPKRCPRCRGRALRVPASGVGVIFRGSGFYVTDHRSKEYKEKARQEKSGGSTSSSGGEPRKRGGDKPSSSGDSRAPADPARGRGKP